MRDDFKRTETTHIDEVSRTATSTVQWLLERAFMAGTHPITHNNKLTVFICGEDSFADIAQHIQSARESIDICCWGFDPGMELVRRAGATWPRGDTFGDLLIAAGKRGVAVRLLVWYDRAAVEGSNPRNMPGHTHGQNYYREELYSEAAAKDLSAQRCLEREQRDVKYGQRNVPLQLIPLAARADYCFSWYEAALHGRLRNVTIRTRSGDASAIKKSLQTEANAPSGLGQGQAERGGMVHFGTHHQKPILIDFFHDDGRHALGYVMGLNSLTDYWDSSAHTLEDPRREEEVLMGKNAAPGCRSMKPYRDYACRIEGGRALVAIYNNFIKAWERASADHDGSAASKSELGSKGMPGAMLRPRAPGDSTVQILRTQPEEGDKTIKDLYFQATDIATNAGGYLYLENQYFQYEEWAQRLLAKRKRVMAGWDAGCAKAGKTMRQMPNMHVFIVIPVPEKAGMIPRTYDTLAHLGQQESMTGQSAMIKEVNQYASAAVGSGAGAGVGAIGKGHPLPEVVAHANAIDKPEAKILETQFGLKVCTAMLNTCGVDGGRWRYREIYIHSKLLLVDDVFLTIGSANLNQRSMAVDSELNMATIDPTLAGDLRRRIWGQLTGGYEDADGGGGTQKDIATAFEKWTKLMSENLTKSLSKSESAERKKMIGFVLPLNDRRRSTMRLG